MKHISFVAVSVAISTIGHVLPAAAQYYRYPSYGCSCSASAYATLGYGSGYGYTHAGATIQLTSRSNQVGQEVALAQSAMIQNSIRTALYNEAQYRSDNLNYSGQANQDWYFQYQAQQLAQRQAAQFAAPTKAAPPIDAPSNATETNETPSGPSPSSLAPASLDPMGELVPSNVPTSYATTYAMGDAPASPRGGPIAGPPPVALDVIQWPKVLQSPSFAAERGQIEAPYRRTPPKLSAPAPADYQKMISIVANMKSILDWKLHEGMRTSDYNGAKAFLDAIEREASARAGSPRLVDTR